MNAQNWYYSINNQQHGPVARTQLDQVLSAHNPAEVLVWSDGMPDWVPASTLGQSVAAPVMPYASPVSQIQGAPQLLGLRRTNGMAIAAMILGIVGIISFGMLIIPQILAVIFGHIALGQCNREPDLDGRGMAIAGLIMGYIFVGIFLFFFLMIFASAMSA